MVVYPSMPALERAGYRMIDVNLNVTHDVKKSPKTLLHHLNGGR
jgi:hypothetical protein